MIGRRCRGGHIYVEMLVVIFIIIAMMSVLLPAVYIGHEASRRTVCASNLSQLTLALQQYDFTQTSFPPGAINDAGPIRSLPSGYHHNWIVQILPFLDERSLSANIDRRVSVYDPRNERVRSTSLPVLHCPSDEGGKGPFSNYAGVHNDAEAPIDATNNGVLFLNSGIRYEDMLDGSSYTAVLGEKIIEPGDLGWMSGTRATLRNTGSVINATGFPPLPPVTGLQVEIGAEDDLRKLNRDIDRRKKSISLQGSPTFVGGFSSRHQGGANFAFAAGGVQFIPESISMNVFQTLGHRSDGRLNKEWP